MAGFFALAAAASIALPRPAAIATARRLFAEASALYLRGRTAAARERLAAARRIDAEPEVDWNLADCDLALRRWKDAAEDLRRYLAGRPDDPRAPALRAKQLWLERRGDPAEAIAERQAALAPEAIAQPPLPVTGPWRRWNDR